MYAETLLTTPPPHSPECSAGPGDRERFRKARVLAEKALTLGIEPADGGEGAARGIIGTSYLVEQDVTPGIEQLERARVLIPERMDFALNLYAMYLRIGDRAKADALYAATFENARDKQTIFAARNALFIRRDRPRQHPGRERQARTNAAIVRGLAESTPTPTAAANSKSTPPPRSHRPRNRHILMYNDAIALSNQGRVQEAMKLLDELLAVATDTAVVQDATKLRGELKKRK